MKEIVCFQNRDRDFWIAAKASNNMTTWIHLIDFKPFYREDWIDEDLITLLSETKYDNEVYESLL